MTVLTLQEAAERTGRSKADIWRAIQAGALSAERSGDGGFAIDPDKLFQVFETQPLEPSPPQEAPDPPEALAPAETSAPPETAATNDIDVAFAELQAELRSLLGPLAQPRAKDEPRPASEPLPGQPPDVIADKAPTAMKPADDQIEKPIPTQASEAPADTAPKRPWWRRLSG
ncbi:MAG: hypothetical protein JO288_14550 [Hyphomicrobiales bacterium]|nr:hypothetical protein [Hyphomicrobiales bacterium]